MKLWTGMGHNYSLLIENFVDKGKNAFMDKIQVTQSSMPPIEDYMDMLQDIWNSHWLTNMGQYHNELSEQLKEYLSINDISLFVNGHMALEMVLQAFNLHGEVVTTPFTFASTTHAIVRNGLTPVFCDIREDDYTIDADQIEELITERTTAIVPVHVYGNVCQTEKIEKIARKHKLKVIYDAAHAFGVRYQGKGIGTFGDASMFSFHATKVFNTIEGGAVAFTDGVLGKSLYQLKNFGIKNQFEVDGIGANAKMNEFQAAMGICNLRYVDIEIKRRKRVYERYLEKLNGTKGIRLPYIQKDVQSNYSYFPIIVDEKMYGESLIELCERLKQKNVYVRRYFYPLTSSYECYHGRFDTAKTPIAKHISDRVAVLPLYADLSIENVDTICKIIRKQDI